MTNTKKANKSIWFILIIFAIIAFGYYNLSNTNSSTNNNHDVQNQGGMDINTDKLTNLDYTLVYSDKGFDYTDIYKISTQDKNPIKIFTDRDENEKIKSAQSINSNNKILALMAPNDQEFVGNLYLILTDGTGDKNKLQENFASTQDPIISPDGTKIAYSLFSNAESDYGFKLIMSNLDGSSKREIANDQTNLVILAWNSSSDKICYQKWNFNENQIITVDVNSLETNLLGTLDNNINNLDWGNNSQFVFSESKQNNLNQSEIYTFKDLLKNYKQITNDDFFDDHPKLTQDNQYIAYYKTKYEDNQPEMFKSGDIYFSKITGENIVKLTTGSDIIGWLQ